MLISGLEELPFPLPVPHKDRMAEFMLASSGIEDVLKRNIALKILVHLFAVEWVLVATNHWSASASPADCPTLSWLFAQVSPVPKDELTLPSTVFVSGLASG